MNVIYLTAPDELPLIEILYQHKDRVIVLTDRLDTVPAGDWIVSYKYRHRVPRSVLAAFSSSAINLHISYLPWNKGCSPRLWAIAEDTPVGVTIHTMTEGIDTGPIIAQETVEYNMNTDTFRSLYDRCSSRIVDLFARMWPTIREGDCRGTQQLGIRSYHTKEDTDRLLQFLPNGWDSPLSVLDGYRAEVQMARMDRESMIREQEAMR